MPLRVGTDLDEATRALRDGQLVAIPTETVYGLAANAFDAEACLRIFEVKRRPAFDPLIVHVRSTEQAREVAAEIPPAAEALMEAFWPGPLTLVLAKRAVIPDIVTSGLDTVALRQPAHALTQKLLEALPFPLAAPSANLFGQISPTTAQHVKDQLGAGIAYLLDGGPCEVGVESTILGWEGERCVLYRPGGIPLEALEDLVGRVTRGRTHVQPAAPGMLESHYAPRTPLELGDLDALLAQRGSTRVGVLSFASQRAAANSVEEILSPSGDLHEAARKLFAALRTLDAAGVERILAEPVPDEGLGRAINDRLRRAAASRSDENEPPST